MATIDSRKPSEVDLLRSIADEFGESKRLAVIALLVADATNHLDVYAADSKAHLLGIGTIGEMIGSNGAYVSNILGSPTDRLPLSLETLGIVSSTGNKLSPFNRWVPTQKAVVILQNAARRYAELAAIAKERVAVDWTSVCFNFRNPNHQLNPDGSLKAHFIFGVTERNLLEDYFRSSYQSDRSTNRLVADLQRKANFLHGLSEDFTTATTQNEVSVPEGTVSFEYDHQSSDELILQGAIGGRKTLVNGLLTRVLDDEPVTALDLLRQTDIDAMPTWIIAVIGYAMYDSDFDTGGIKGSQIAEIASVTTSLITQNRKQLIKIGILSDMPPHSPTPDAKNHLLYASEICSDAASSLSGSARKPILTDWDKPSLNLFRQLDRKISAAIDQTDPNDYGLLAAQLETFAETLQHFANVAHRSEARKLLPPRFNIARPRLTRSI